MAITHVIKLLIMLNACYLTLNQSCNENNKKRTK